MGTFVLRCEMTGQAPMVRVSSADQEPGSGIRESVWFNSMATGRRSMFAKRLREVHSSPLTFRFPPTQPCAMNDNRVRALVIDDEPSARDAIVTFLGEHSRIQLEGCAKNGREAVTLTRATQ